MYILSKLSPFNQMLVVRKLYNISLCTRRPQVLEELDYDYWGHREI
jgi:hypothetical protein